MLLAALATGALLGLGSIPHCAGMCGPLAAFACSRGRKSAPIGYQLGRTMGYAALGAAAGGAGGALGSLTAAPWLSALISWALAVALLVMAVRLWCPRVAETAAPAGESPVKPDVPARSLFARGARALPRSPVVLGGLTTLLPCGALAGAALIAAGTTDPVLGGAVMAAFATTSGVGLLGAGWLAGRLRRLGGTTAGRVLAVTLVAGAVVLAVRPLPMLSGDPEVCPGHAAADAW